ncbi:MAG TPA: ComF family protein [Hyphomicrobiaceae bacterium]|nr:ComF family protein [Hyphomicrobiaceae bacterium]
MTTTAIRPDPELTDGEPSSGDQAPPWRLRLRLAASGLSNIVMPPVCAACQTCVDRHHTLCAQCWSALAFIRPPLCDRMGIPLPFDTGGKMLSAAALANPPDYDRARSAAFHAGTMRRLIHGMKYQDRSDAMRLLTSWLASAGDELLREADMLVPVPLARGRLLWRRFNQSAELARMLSIRSGVPYHWRVLKRRRATPPQVGMTMAQRRQNVAGAFVVPPRMKAVIAGKSIVLVDDVLTTGATVEACARVLKRAGAARVDVLTLSRASGDIITPQ